jgi:integrase
MVEELSRDVARLRVRRIGRVVDTGEGREPFVLVDSSGEPVVPVAEYLRALRADGSPATTQRSYCYELLGWFRFLWAVDVAWDRAGRREARDYALWLAQASKGSWRRDPAGPVPGSRNPVTGKPYPAQGYATESRRHARAVVHAFYEYHRDEHGRPLLNPFPRERSEASGGVNAHRNPMHPARQPRRRAPYQPKAAKRIPRAIPDERFNEVFAALRSHRDRALLAFWVSTAARATELLTVVRGAADPIEQQITVVRKGSGAAQLLPASADAFVWLRLYQAQLGESVPHGAGDPLWWTLRRPLRPLSYDAARMMFTRAQATLGSNWSIHDLRHTAAYRMAADPHVSLVDIQWVLGHAHLSTSEIYLTPSPDQLVEKLLAHHARRKSLEAIPVQPAPGYRPALLDTLFGTSSTQGPQPWT